MEEIKQKALELYELVLRNYPTNSPIAMSMRTLINSQIKGGLQATTAIDRKRKDGTIQIERTDTANGLRRWSPAGGKKTPSQMRSFSKGRLSAAAESVPGPQVQSTTTESGENENQDPAVGKVEPLTSDQLKEAKGLRASDVAKKYSREVLIETLIFLHEKFNDPEVDLNARNPKQLAAMLINHLSE